MTAPISKIGGSRTVTRDAGSDGHDQVAKKLDTQNQKRPVNQKVMDVAKMYERQFLGEMFKAMRSTVSETDKPSMAQNIYNSQRDEQYVDAWSEQGGIGFSNIIYDQVMEKFFGQTQQGRALKQQGMIPLTNRDIAKVSEVKSGVATPIIPRDTGASASAALTSAAQSGTFYDSTLPMQMPITLPSMSDEALRTSAKAGEARTVENTEPMPAPTPPQADMRTLAERVAAGEHFPTTAVARDPNAKTSNGDGNGISNVKTSPLPQTALQIEVRPSPTGQPAKIQAPWDATVINATKLDGSRTAVTLEHGQGLRSTLVFDGVLSGQATVGLKILRGESIATLNQDAKSFLWNLAPQGAQTSRTE